MPNERTDILSQMVQITILIGFASAVYFAVKKWVKDQKADQQAIRRQLYPNGGADKKDATVYDYAAETWDLAGRNERRLNGLDKRFRRMEKQIGELRTGGSAVAQQTSNRLDTHLVRDHRGEPDGD